MSKKRYNPFGEEGEEIIGCGSEIIDVKSWVHEEIPYWLIPHYSMKKTYEKSLLKKYK